MRAEKLSASLRQDASREIPKNARLATHCNIPRSGAISTGPIETIGALTRIEDVICCQATMSQFLGL